MNSIRRSRRRPRKASVNFRTFFWVLTREAALRVLGLAGQPLEPWSDARRFLVAADLARIRFLVDAELTLRPERRYWP